MTVPRTRRCEAHRPLPLVPGVHDDLPIGGALHAPRRSRPGPHRGDLRAALARPADPCRAGGGAALSRPVPGGAGGGLAARAHRGALWTCAATARKGGSGRGGGWCFLRPPCRDAGADAGAAEGDSAARPLHPKFRARAASFCCKAVRRRCSRPRSTRLRSGC